MKKGISKYLVLLVLLGTSGCQSIAQNLGTGFVMISLILGIPVFILLFLGNIVEGIRNKEKGGELGSDFLPSLFHLVWILVIVGLFVKGCNDYVN